MQCYLCTRVFEQKAPLREHLQQAHDFSALNKASSATDMAADANTKLVGQITNAEGELCIVQLLECGLCF